MNLVWHDCIGPIAAFAGHGYPFAEGARHLFQHLFWEGTLHAGDGRCPSENLKRVLSMNIDGFQLAVNRIDLYIICASCLHASLLRNASSSFQMCTLSGALPVVRSSTRAILFGFSSARFSIADKIGWGMLAVFPVFHQTQIMVACHHQRGIRLVFSIWLAFQNCRAGVGQTHQRKADLFAVLVFDDAVQKRLQLPDFFQKNLQIQMFSVWARILPFR